MRKTCFFLWLLPSSGLPGSSQSIVISSSSSVLFQPNFDNWSSPPPPPPPPRSEGGADEQRERTDMEHPFLEDGNPAAHNSSANWRNASSRLWTCDGVLVCESCFCVRRGTLGGDVGWIGRRPLRRRGWVVRLETESCAWDDNDDTAGFSITEADTKQSRQR